MSWWGEKENAAASGGAPCPSSRALEVRRSWFGMAVGVALVLLLVLAPGAWAAPANDNFANAEDLGAGFPVVTETWSNVDATEEAGEPYDVFAAGHSVWFQWEATTSEVVTIDTCNSEFSTSLTVFAGTELDTLAEVGYDSSSNGRFCPDAAGVTFRPETGTTYSIMIDGNGFGFPEGPSPVTQGSFELKVAKTPSPPNDNFADPVVLSGSVGGSSYSASTQGFNWNATKEAGEPDHGGDQGGASIWYEWTAPASGKAELGACSFSFDFFLGLYTGSSVGALTPVPLESRPVPCFINFVASAGTTYRIALDGKFDIGTGMPKMGSLGIRVSMKLPQQVSAGGGSSQQQPADTRPPKTAISRRVLKRVPPVWVFSFGSNEPGSTFQCKLDKRPFKKCRASKTFRRLKPGKHTLKVRAIDPSGNVDKSPAVARFTVPGGAHTRN